MFRLARFGYAFAVALLLSHAAPQDAWAQAADQQVLVEKAASSFRVVSQEKSAEPHRGDVDADRRIIPEQRISHGCGQALRQQELVDHAAKRDDQGEPE